MTRTASPLHLDLPLHALIFAGQMLWLALTGFGAAGTLPPFVLPAFFLLAALTLIRIHEHAPQLGSRLVMVPALIATALYLLMLLLDMGGLLWGFAMPRQFPVWARVVWYQSGLLLMHPWVYQAVRTWGARSAHALRRRGYLHGKVWVVMLVAGAGLWLVRSQNISSDGYDWLKYSLWPDQWALYLREPLGTLVFHLVSWAGIQWLGFSPSGSIALLSIACGLAAFWLAAQVIARLFDERDWGLIFALMLASGGVTQVFAGNIEIYALLIVGYTAFLYAALRYLGDEWPAWPAGVVFGLLFCTHLSSGWWLPAFMLLPIVKALMGRVAANPLRPMSELYLSALFVAGTFFVFLLNHGYGGDLAAMNQHFWGDRVMRVGTDNAMFHPLSAYFTADYYLTLLNEYFYLAAWLFLLLPTLMLALRAWVQPDALTLWLALMAGMYGLYSLVWRADRPMPSDWDIFSGVTLPLVLTLGRYWTRLALPQPVIAYVLYQCCVFSGGYVVLLLLRNHFKVTEWPLFL